VEWDGTDERGLRANSVLNASIPVRSVEAFQEELSVRIHPFLDTVEPFEKQIVFLLIFKQIFQKE